MEHQLSVEELSSIHGGIPIPYPQGPGGDVGWVQTDIKPSEAAGAVGAISGMIPGGQITSGISWLAAIVLNHFGD